MAEKEYTKVIIDKIRRSKVNERIMLVLLTVNISSQVTYYIPGDLINPSISANLYSMGYAPTQIVFIGMFTYQLGQVNE